MLLLSLILIPILTAIVVGVARERQAKVIALIGSVLTLILARWLFSGFDYTHAGEVQFFGAWDLLPQMGIRLSLGVDAVSLVLVILTLAISMLAVLGSFSAVTRRIKEYYIWLLVLQAAITGVFAARDLIVFYICFEFTLLPMYFLIAVYGSANRARASTVFFLYTFTGSMITLAGLIYIGAQYAAAHNGVWTFDIGVLTNTAAHMTHTQQAWVLLALCCGFAVKVPLFPVHTWLPLAHTEAPTAGSVILAALLLKLGTYGLYRFALPMCPQAILTYAPFIAVLCIIGILYAALVCWVQRDVKKLIAYSSVAHLGFCVLGLVALNEIGIAGSIMYMVNHALSTGALFLCLGMMYERFHSRSMDELGGLARRMPIWATFTIFFVLSSVGLPGLNGFIGEFMTVIGAFTSGQIVNGHATFGALGPWYAAAGGSGMILAAIYLLYFAGFLVWGKYHSPAAATAASRIFGAGHHDPDHHARQPMPLPRDLNLREIIVLAPLALACIWLGVHPATVLDPINEPVVAMVDHLAHPQRPYLAGESPENADVDTASSSSSPPPVAAGDIHHFEASATEVNESNP